MKNATRFITIDSGTFLTSVKKEGRDFRSICPGRGLRTPYTAVYVHFTTVYDRILAYYMIQYYDRISP